jgi:hypothetical protein
MPAHKAALEAGFTARTSGEKNLKDSLLGHVLTTDEWNFRTQFKPMKTTILVHLLKDFRFSAVRPKGLIERVLIETIA